MKNVSTFLKIDNNPGYFTSNNQRKYFELFKKAKSFDL